MFLITVFVVAPFIAAVTFFTAGLFSKKNRKEFWRTAGIAALVWLFACSIRAIVYSVY